MRRIGSLEHVEAGLVAILEADPRLATVAEIAGPLPLRLRPGGFVGLAEIITYQQISGAAAASIWARFAAAVEPFTPKQLLLTPEDVLRSAGLSRPKIRTLRAVSEACLQGLDLQALHDAAAEDGVIALTTIPGIGRWTAELYLLVCVGHPDIFPAGDLALQIAVQEGLGLAERPKEKPLRAMAEGWSPWRSVAARLFWTYYRVRRNLGRPPI